MGFTLRFTSQARKDFETLVENQNQKLVVNARRLLAELEQNPWRNPPSYEKLGGNLKGLISRRLNNQHRLVYRVIEGDGIVLIVSAWTHYE